jgi:hypothetical protein
MTPAAVVVPAGVGREPAWHAERGSVVIHALGTVRGGAVMTIPAASVVRGTARAVVVATGMATERGRIARLLESAGRERTPLQARIDRVGCGLLWVSLGLSMLIVSLGLARGVPPFELLLTGVSSAVAAVPEGSPAVVTIALALGVPRMARRNAIIRRLPSVETLGCAQVICTDTTGTLTLGFALGAVPLVVLELLTVWRRRARAGGPDTSSSRQSDSPAMTRGGA